MAKDHEQPELDLEAPGSRELIELTNTQFDFWDEMLGAESEEPIRSGNLMNFWFILSRLAQQTPDYRMVKKDTFGLIGREQETARKYVSLAERMGFAETVRSKGVVYLQLTPAGRRAVARTLHRWIDRFGEIHQKFFSGRS